MNVACRSVRIIAITTNRRRSAQTPRSPQRRSSARRRSSLLASGNPVLSAGQDIVLLLLDLGGYDVDMVLPYSLQGRHAPVQELHFQVKCLRIRAPVHLGLDLFDGIDHVGELLILAPKGQA